MPSAGSIKSITCQSPLYGTFTFDPVADGDSTYMLNGVISQENSKTLASGRRLQVMNPMGASFKADPIAWDTEDKTLENLNLLSGEPGGQTWTMTSYASPDIYRLSNGYPVGQFEGSGTKGAITLSLEGERLEII